MRKITAITIMIICTLCLATAAFAATPAIRLTAPSSAKAGETITITVEAEIAPQDEISAYCATLKWKTEQLTPAGAAELKNSTLSDKLATKTDNTKGISEISAAAMTQPLKVTKQEKITLATQNFKLASDLKTGDTVKIGFTTDPKISVCGTQYSTKEGTKEFKIITGTAITIK